MIFHWPYRPGERNLVRAALLARGDGACERCRKERKSWRLVVHHEHYTPELRLGDFLLLCLNCHRKRHFDPDAPRLPLMVEYPPRRPLYSKEFAAVMASALGGQKPGAVARRAGLETSSVSRAVRYGRVPTRRVTYRIAEALELGGRRRAELLRAAGYIEVADDAPTPQEAVAS